MEDRTVIKLDLTGCKSSYDMQLVIQKAFDFPDWYGKTWDAFWDLLMGIFVNTDIELYGVSTLPEQTEKHMAIMLKVLQRKKEEMEELSQRKPEFGCRFDYQVID